jgi:hypothetical protein
VTTTFGLPQSIATFASGWVGFLGVEKIRNIADRLTDFKLPSRKAELVRLHFANAASGYQPPGNHWRASLTVTRSATCA